MANINNNDLPFFPIVEKMELIIGHATDVLELISLVNKAQFLDIRSKVIDVFQIGGLADFDGNFGTEIELGDVSDSMREITFSRYPRSTAMDKMISLAERRDWCKQIMDAMDSNVVLGG